MRIQKLLTTATLLLAGCGCENPKGTDTTPVSTPVFSPTPSPELQQSPANQLKASTQLKQSCLPIEEPPTDNVFDPSKLQIGSRFMGLTITKMDASCEKKGDNGEYLGTATFQGKIIVSGAYDPKYDVEGFENVCFDVVRQDDLRLPRIWGDRHTPWFCFDKPERTMQLLSAEKALLAKIVIDFTTVHEHKGVINRANLVGVIDPILIKL